MPYITDISNWAKIFSGGNATIFTYELPLLEFSTGFDVELARIPIPFPPLSWLNIVIGAVGSMRATIDLSFGFDTFGVQKAVQSGNPLDVIDGFFINDWTLPSVVNGVLDSKTGGKEKPEFSLALELGLLGGLGIPGAAAGLGGSVTFMVDADFNDIKQGTIKRDSSGQFLSVSYVGDGKVRASEALAMMSYPGLIPGIPGGPLNLFDFRFQVAISPYIWAKVGVGLFSVSANVKLFSLNLPAINVNAPTIKPDMGVVQNGVLTLFAVDRASER